MEKLPQPKSPETDEFIQARASNRKLEAEIIQLLESYYKDKNMDEKSKLGIRRIGGGGSFWVQMPANPSYQTNPPPEEDLVVELHKAQADMQAFGKFLKDRFFASA